MMENGNLTTFHQLAFNGNFEEVRRLLEIYPEYLNATDSRENTVLMFACGGQHLELAKWLIDRGADAFQVCWHRGNAISFLKLPVHQQEIYQYAYDLTPDGINIIARRKKDFELVSEASESNFMQAEDKRMREFFRAEAELCAWENKLMGKEEAFTRRMIYRANQITMTTRRKLSSGLVNSAIKSIVVAMVTAHRQEIRAKREAERLRLKKLEKNRKKREARKMALLSGNPLPTISTKILNNAAASASASSSGVRGESVVVPLPPIRSSRNNQPLPQQQQIQPETSTALQSVDSSDDEDIGSEDEEEKEFREFARKLIEAREAEERRIVLEMEEKLRAEKVEAEKKLKALREAERIARLEWNQMQADIRRKEADAFEAAKPQRILQYNRHKLALKKL